MTFSNVNPDVVELNAKAIGLFDYPKYKVLRLGRLHDLVGQRNDIGHGGLIVPPTNDRFIDLLNFTEGLVKDYTDLFVDRINSFALQNDLKLNAGKRGFLGAASSPVECPT